MPLHLHMIEEVFGHGCDLYKLLKCNADSTKAQLRKGYYRAALKVHPDKNTGNNDGSADTTKQFQAISMAYQILQDENLRQDYDETGVIPDNNDVDHNDDDKDMSGSDAWKSYFDLIFGKVTTSKIDSFAAKYKCSDEERRDVLREFKSRQGNLVKMLDFVMLSEPRDAIRWVEDYIRPAFYNNDTSNNDDDDNDAISDKDKKDAAAWKSTMEKTLSKLQKQVEKENQQQSAAAAAANEAEDNDDDDDDDDMEDDGETETEDDDEKDATPQQKKKQASSSRKSAASSSSGKKPASAAAKKGKPLQAKHAKKSPKTNTSNKNNSKNKQGGGSMDDLIAQIQNKRRGGGGGGNAWADLGARYGVPSSSNDNDPLNDEEFAKIQAGLGNKKKGKKGQR